jgi:hypothetical protein
MVNSFSSVVPILPEFQNKGKPTRKRRKKEYLNLPNEKFLGVQNPFFKKGFGRRRQK